MIRSSTCLPSERDKLSLAASIWEDSSLDKNTVNKLVNKWVRLNPFPDLAQHVGSQQVVFVLQDAYGGDGRLLMEAAGLPALIPAAALTQVDAEDLPWSAAVKKHRDLWKETKEPIYFFCLSFFLTLKNDP